MDDYINRKMDVAHNKFGGELKDNSENKFPGVRRKSIHG